MKPTAEIVSQLLSAHGVRDIVLSPGSRNAPLVLAIQNNTDLKIRTIIDERVAAFVALGMARQKRRAVALVCTSGTAMLNYAPAVAEAYYQGIPLLLFTADRPMQWIDQDDSQTIRQYGALGNVVKNSYDIPDSPWTDTEMRWYAVRTVNEAILNALDGKCGPVHVNCQFNAPLTSGAETPADYAAPKVKLIKGVESIDVSEAKRLAECLCEKKVLVVSGFMNPDNQLSRILRRFMALPNVAFLPEALSNLHLNGLGGIDKIITGVDKITLDNLLPDVVITMGGALLSRKVKEWLRKAPDTMEHWSIDNADTLADCLRHLHYKISIPARSFFSSVGRQMARMDVHSDYSLLWHKASECAMRSSAEFIRTAPWSDLLAHNILYSSVPKQWNIYCSNGTSVRYAELFADWTQHQIGCNRGTSGIEGCTSTAVGVALSSSHTTLLVSGDMSLRHDLGGLALPCVPPNLKIVTFANGGGDIFRFIGATRSVDGREENFACPDLCTAPLSQLAPALGYRYLRATDTQSLRIALNILYKSVDKTLLEIVTPVETNSGVLDAYMSRAVDNNFIPRH